MLYFVTIIVILSSSGNSLLLLNETNVNPNQIINFLSAQTCLNIINFQAKSNSSYVLNEYLSIWHSQSVTILDTNSTKIIPQLVCKLFVIFYEFNAEILQQINFKPFSQILIITTDNLLNSENLQNFYFKKSINLLAVVDSGNRYDLNEYLNEQRFIDRLLRDEREIINLRASFFHCPPFVIILNQDVKNDVDYDGVEMRCLLEIARNWNLSYVDTTNSVLVSDRWETTLHDISNNVSDVAMCSVWQNNAHGAVYDLSSYIDIQCVTVLVPKPSPITQARIIYLPFKREVWLLFATTMLLTAILIRFAICVESRIYMNRIDRKYAEFSKILLDMINISTAHGLFRFPYRFGIKLFFFGWILTMLLVDTAYSTGYTSIMTIPQYSKSIDTLNDFLTAGLRWSEPADIQMGIREDIANTGSPDFVQFAEGLIHEKNQQHRIHLLKRKKIGKLVKVLSNKFVTDIDKVGDYASSMKPIKECLFNYYTVYAFRKNSPFKKIFDRQISRMKTAGLFDTWFDHLILQYFNQTLMAQVMDHHSGRKNERNKLQLRHLIGGFYLLFGGLILSIGVFGLEVLWVKLNLNNFIW